MEEETAAAAEEEVVGGDETGLQDVGDEIRGECKIKAYSR